MSGFASRLVALQVLTVRILLRLYPAGFRRVFGAEMVQTYRAKAAHTFARRGTVALMRLWAVTTADMVRMAAQEQFTPGNRWQRIGGLALIGGGLLWVLLHLPSGMGWFQSPPIAMALLLIGLASMNYERAKTQHAAPRQWGGFVVTAVGLMVVLAGYMAAWMGGWQQTGGATLVGAVLQSAGLLTMGMTAQQGDRVWPMLLIAGLVSGCEAVWLGLFLRQGALLESVVSVLGLVGFGVIGGLCWMALGVMVWREGEEDVSIPVW